MLSKIKNYLFNKIGWNDNEMFVIRPVLQGRFGRLTWQKKIIKPSETYLYSSFREKRKSDGKTRVVYTGGTYVSDWS